MDYFDIVSFHFLPAYDGQNFSRTFFYILRKSDRNRFTIKTMIRIHRHFAKDSKIGVLLNIPKNAAFFNEMCPFLARFSVLTLGNGSHT
ncbi:hypothetical protein D3C81_1638540 [compost metagenome]